MRVFFRIVGLVFLALALILLVADGTRMLAANGYVATPLGNWIAQIAPLTLESARTAVQENVHPLLWDPTLTTLLAWPGWAVLGGIAIIFLLLGRSKTRRRTVVSIDQL
ncbi:hypothetical protein [Pelagibacterium xiamenense]|uniref:hypothetical protein n=1 Tax=Pelagibacterium xiamenense TaxID=2901140 RepID=UPI001E359444|nr:hypothetical protein [Pelagibacterium xiamenense]MCD7058771.1 hypothetical protein [Pelagibacterium xiamenense]